MSVLSKLGALLPGAVAALGEVVEAILAGDEKAAVVAAKKAVAKQAVKAAADRKRKALGR
jgi:hypothetical protein